MTVPMPRIRQQAAGALPGQQNVLVALDDRGALVAASRGAQFGASTGALVTQVGGLRSGKSLVIDPPTNQCRPPERAHQLSRSTTRSSRTGST